jgi:hypothetical protein
MDFQEEDIKACQNVHEFTMTSPERLYALRAAVRYVVANRIPGAIVECGVWRGGSMMTVANVLREMGDMSRELWLYDTFDGMPPPGPQDASIEGKRASDLLAGAGREEWIWAVSSLDEVTRAVYSTGYDRGRIHFIKGRVEDTLPAQAPTAVSLLRLDTDWYSSTRHELDHLFPRLSPRGVLIIDDYGHWRGARQATDEYFATLTNPPLLNRIDYTCRLALKI